jgi:aminopeptidase YwaD
MRIFFLLLLVSGTTSMAQKLKKADKAILANLQAHVTYLADDRLEGRRTGTAGEKLASDYISQAFQKAGLQPKGDNGGYLQAFTVNEGREVNPASHLIINGHDFVFGEEYFPLALSPNASIEVVSAIALPERGAVWFWNIGELLEQNKDNPHFDLAESVRSKAGDAAGMGATALVVYNSSTISDGLKFDPMARPKPVTIPVVYVTKTAKDKYLKDETAMLDIKLKTDLREKMRSGHNVVGYLDYGAPTTVVIGAHFDHLGYGEDRNSLYTGTTPMIHNGADDNASGTAALIELAGLLSKSKYKNNNYVFVAFSGEELGLYGSKHFTANPTVPLNTINYMINMDMIGRLNDSSRSITVGGFGTSPVWGELIRSNRILTVKTDSSGTGPSDHSSFYYKDIPVLFFFTGTHMDYHKPSDDADKINYMGELLLVKYIQDCIGSANDKGKLPFTKTREQTVMKTSFKVTLGVMLDYTYSGGDGVKVDGVSDNRPAAKAGIQAGDIITKLGEHSFYDVTEYMKALGKFNKGETTKVAVLRGGKTLVFDITF